MSVAYHKANGPFIKSPDNFYWAWLFRGKSHRYYGPYNSAREWCIHGVIIKW